MSTVNRLHYGCLGDVSLRPWHLHWRWLEHENSHTANRVVVFLCTPPVVTYTPAYTASHIPDSQPIWDTVVALVMSWPDYGNGVLVGLPAYLVCWLQWVLNASARMIFQLCHSNDISLRLPVYTGCASQSTSSLRSLCWRIKFFIGLYRATACPWVSFTGSVLSPLCQHWSLLLRRGTLCQRK